MYSYNSDLILSDVNLHSFNVYIGINKDFSLSEWKLRIYLSGFQGLIAERRLIIRYHSVPNAAETFPYICPSVPRLSIPKTTIVGKIAYD